MISAIDSSVLFDIIKGTPEAEPSLQALTAAAQRGVTCVSAPVVAELGRYFGKTGQLQEFFVDAGIVYSEISFDSALTASTLMHEYGMNRGSKSRMAADFLIGAHAMLQADCLITRDNGFFRDYFKGLKIINPVA
jgi:predicted nucleic acid-binding protein